MIMLVHVKFNVIVIHFILVKQREILELKYIFKIKLKKTFSYLEFN